MINTATAACPICGSSSSRGVGSAVIPDRVRSLIRENYSLLKCKNCRYYYVSPGIRFNDHEWSELYSDGYFSEMTNWWANKRKKERNYTLGHLERFSENRIENFLEVGCGEGHVLLDALQKGWKVHSVDVYDNRMESAKNDNITFLAGDIFKAQYPDNYFDCIYMDSVLEHVPDPVAYLAEINRILKKDGLLYIAVPNEDALVYDFKKLVYRLCGKGKVSACFQPFLTPYHVNGFTKKSLFTALSNANFKVEKFRNYAGWYEFLKFRFPSRSFIKALVLLPVHLSAISLQKQMYQDVIVRKME